MEFSLESPYKPAGDQPLHLEHEELFNRLSMRVGSLIYPMRTYGVFREAEDRRRLVAGEGSGAHNRVCRRSRCLRWIRRGRHSGHS